MFLSIFSALVIEIFAISSIWIVLGYYCNSVYFGKSILLQL
jgi:hypothetical protein